MTLSQLRLLEARGAAVRERLADQLLGFGW